jgi:hypothetical protein
MERIKHAIEKARDSADQLRAERVGSHSSEASSVFKAGKASDAMLHGGPFEVKAHGNPRRLRWPTLLLLGFLSVGSAWFLMGLNAGTVPAPAQDQASASSTGVPSAAIASPPQATQAARPGPTDQPPSVGDMQPSVAAEPAPASASQEAQVAAAVEAWRLAWAARDMVNYLDAYSRTFVPGGGVSRQDWVANRYRNVGGRPSIDVVIRNVKIEPLTQDSVQVSFLQDYASGAFRELDQLKTLDLAREDKDRWRIVREWQGAAPPVR